MKIVTLNVPDISCEHCERTITGALGPIEGVKSVQVDIPMRTVRVAYDEDAVTVDGIKETLADEDYPVESIEPAAS